MATVTLTFEAGPVFVKLPDENRERWGETLQSDLDPVIRAVAREYADNGTTSGTVTITAT